jgi:hypothetical protein
LRALLQGLALEPTLARRHELPRVDEPGPDAAAWNALLDHCISGTSEPTTASVIQHFSGTAHADAIAAALALAADQALTVDQVEADVLAAAERLRRAEAQRAVSALLEQPLSALTAAQREMLAKVGRKAD